MRHPSLEAGLFIALITACAAAQTVAIDISYQKFVLDNGLTVIVHEDHKAPIVAVNMWYHVGSKNEVPGKTGFAHLFEHLMFGGSENAKGSYIQSMEKVGATDMNGTTNPDRTNYFENVPTTALDYALFMESDRMGHFINSFDKKILDQQRGVVQNEKRQGENQPYGVTRQIISRNIYPAAHPYSWTTIGSMEDLNAASLDDVKEWFRTYYGPSNTVMVLAGDIDAQTAKEKVTRYFGDIPAGPPVAHQEEWIAKMTGVHRARVEDRVAQARIYKIWNVPGFGTAAADYLDLVTDCLTKGKVSRLYKRLVYDDQTATDVNAFMNNTEIGGNLYIQATARAGQDLTSVEKAIDEELARFLAEGPTAAELKRVQTQYTANFLRGMERIGGFGGKSDILAQGQVYTRDPSYLFKTSLRRHQQATPAQMKAVSNQWLADGVFVLEVLPFKDYKTVTTKLDRSKPPEMSGTPEAKLPKLQRTQLSNGLKVILAERHEIPIVDFGLIQDAGFAADGSMAPGLASMTNTMLPNGTRTRSALQISEQVESLGAELRTTTNLDLSTLGVSALKSNLDASLALFADVALNPAFPKEDFLRLQKQRIAQIQREKVTPIQMALRVVPPLLYGTNHAYGVPYTGSGTEESVARMMPEDLVKFHSTWYRPNNGTLVIVGDTTLAEITPKLEKALGQWKQGKTPVKTVANVDVPAHAQVYLIDKPGAQQSVIIASLIAPPKSSSNDIALQTLTVLFGGNFGARMNMNLREDKHYSYGAQTVLLGARAQRPFIAIAPVQTDKTKESLIEVNREFHDLVASRPVTADELARAQLSQTLEIPGSRETIAQVSRSISNLIQYGLPDDYYDTFASKVKALQTSSVDDAAKSVIRPDNLIWVIVGDRAKIESGIRELKLGDVQVLDNDGKKM